MKISEIFWINTKKLTKRTKKAMFLIIPIGVLIALSVVVSSQIFNIQNAVDSSVFGTIDEQNTLIRLEVEEEDQIATKMMGGGGSIESNNFTDSDVAVLLNIDDVESVSLLSRIPIRNISIDDLFEEAEIEISNLIGLDSNTSSLYTDSDFVYVEGEPIPIVLNASTFINSYEDWGGEEEIAIGLGAGQGGNREEILKVSPFKTEAIGYEKEDLLGEEITISLGGLDSLSTIEVIMGTLGKTIRKLSDEEIQETEEAREIGISEYWDYERLSQKLTYTFKVVGVIEDPSNRETYIPEAFADVLMYDYLSNQLDALEGDVPNDLLNADFTGLTYDGYELSSTGIGVINQMAKKMGSGMGRIAIGGSSGSLNSNSIPGLVIELDEYDEVIGIYDDPTVYTGAERYAQSISIKIDNVSNRSSVVDDINKAGYAFQDLSDMEVFGELQRTLSSVSTGLIISFVVLVAGVVVLTMSKMVSESTKEIGIFRAIGMKKNDISLMFILQALLYVLIGYGSGIVLGVILNLGVSSLIASWFNSFVQSTISESFSVIETVESSVFLNISWSAIWIYSLLLLGISLLVSFFPARSAASISPVVAINNE